MQFIQYIHSKTRKRPLHSGVRPAALTEHRGSSTVMPHDHRHFVICFLNKAPQMVPHIG